MSLTFFVTFLGGMHRRSATRKVHHRPEGRRFTTVLQSFHFVGTLFHILQVVHWKKEEKLKTQ